MKKASQSLNQTSEKKANQKKKKDEDWEVNIDKLMDDLKYNILEVYGIKDKSSQEYIDLS